MQFDFHLKNIYHISIICLSILIAQGSGFQLNKLIYYLNPLLDASLFLETGYLDFSIYYFNIEETVVFSVAAVELRQESSLCF